MITVSIDNVELPVKMGEAYIDIITKVSGIVTSISCYLTENPIALLEPCSPESKPRWVAISRLTKCLDHNEN